MIFFISRKWYSIGEALKRIFFRNLGIVRLVAVERDVKPRNMNFAKVEREGVINREGAFIRINTINRYVTRYHYYRMVQMLTLQVYMAIGSIYFETINWIIIK